MKAEELLAKEHLTVDDCLKLYDEVGLLGLLDRVKELSRKVGIKEVVEWIEENKICPSGTTLYPDYIVSIGYAWRTKLKEWGIK